MIISPKQVYRPWDTKRRALKEYCSTRDIVDHYGIYEKVKLEDGTYRDPTPEEVTARVEKKIGPDLLFICTDEIDEKVKSFLRPVMETDPVSSRAIVCSSTNLSCTRFSSGSFSRRTVILARRFRISSKEYISNVSWPMPAQE